MINKNSQSYKNFKERADYYHSEELEQEFKSFIESIKPITLIETGLEHTGKNNPDFLATLSNGNIAYIDVKQTTIGKFALERYLEIIKTKYINVICVRKLNNVWVYAGIKDIDKVKGEVFPGKQDKWHSGKPFYRPNKSVWKKII